MPILQDTVLSLIEAADAYKDSRKKILIHVSEKIKEVKNGETDGLSALLAVERLALMFPIEEKHIDFISGLKAHYKLHSARNNYKRMKIQNSPKTSRARAKRTALIDDEMAVDELITENMRVAQERQERIDLRLRENPEEKVIPQIVDKEEAERARVARIAARAAKEAKYIPQKIDGPVSLPKNQNTKITVIEGHLSELPPDEGISDIEGFKL